MSVFTCKNCPNMEEGCSNMEGCANKNIFQCPLISIFFENVN